MKYAFALFLLSLAPACAVAANSTPALIPLPQKMECRKGVFRLLPKTQIQVDPASQATGEYLADRLRRGTGYQLSVVSRAKPRAAKGALILTTRDAKAALGPEGYELTVTPKSVVIRASGQAGMFYGVQTLLQLLPPEVLAPNSIPGWEWTIPCVQIQDQPRFKWRGFMLDVARHFFTKDEVKQLLDALALHKINTLHLHLTDDQGWRIEIKKYPRLTQIGAWRDEAGFGLDPKLSTAYGPDGRYGGFYTQDDIRELVAYAAARHITIVPEIEMPGHSMRGAGRLSRAELHRRALHAERQGRRLRRGLLRGQRRDL